MPKSKAMACGKVRLDITADNGSDTDLLTPIATVETCADECCVTPEPTTIAIVASYNICTTDGCVEKANFKAQGQRLYTACVNHKESGMIKRAKICHHDLCDVVASYGVKGGRPTHCFKHSTPSMKGLLGFRCQHPNCDAIAVYGIPGQTPTKCRKHKGQNEVKVYGVCKTDGCKEPSTHGPKGTRKRVMCSDHADESMIRQRSGKKCEINGCDLIASKGILGMSPKTCADHAKPEYVNLVVRSCEISGCFLQPSFGEKGGIPCRCGEHRITGDVNLTKSVKLCTREGCKKTAKFKFPGKPCTACKDHKTPDMVSLSLVLCDMCETIAGYGYFGSKPTRCFKHKKPDMCDIVNRRCDDCKTAASYGYVTQSATKCSTHIQNGMILYPRKRCCTASCTHIGTFMSATNKEVRFCEEHKPADAINLVATTCSKCGLTDVVNNDGLCSDCDPEAIKKYAHAKELFVKSWLDANGYKYISYDRTIEQGACLLVRPDFIFDAGTHFIIIEVDENQHKTYPCECEQTRMINIAQALGMSCIFIRYNPDSYKDAAGKRCNPSHLTRMKLLRKWLDLCLDPAQSPEASGSFVNAAYLYYDGHNDTDTQMQTLQRLDGASTLGRDVTLE